MAKQNTKTTKTKKIRAPRTAGVFDAFKSAALVVSVVINLFVLIGWLTLKVTSQYDEQVAGFLFGS